jgi:quercetin dioxygenase-like cupin family protein
MTYKQKNISERVFIREFSETVETTELIWHRDRQDRTIKVLEGTGWKIQFDNSLPEELQKGTSINIPKMVFHRLWKGTNKLIIEITENV